jgi:hypothetical protein
MVPLAANDGTLNGIDLAAALPTWSDLINEADSCFCMYSLICFLSLVSFNSLSGIEYLGGSVSE